MLGSEVTNLVVVFLSQYVIIAPKNIVMKILFKLSQIDIREKTKHYAIVYHISHYSNRLF